MKKIMDKKSFRMVDNSNGKQNRDTPLIGQLVKQTSTIMSEVSDDFEPTVELKSAIKDENIAEIR